jgi:hypothetical protein
LASRNTHLGRYRRIADVLSRHGLGYMVGVLRLEASCSNTRRSWDIHGGKSPTPVPSTCACYFVFCFLPANLKKVESRREDSNC